MSSGRQELIALNRAVVFLLKHPYIACVLLPACWLPLLLCTPPLQRSLRDCQGNFGCEALNPSSILVAFGLFLPCPTNFDPVQGNFMDSL